jgi:hypothetical protein
VFLSLLGYVRKILVVELMLEGLVEEPGQLAPEAVSEVEPGCNQLSYIVNNRRVLFPSYLVFIAMLYVVIVHICFDLYT